MKTIEKRKNIFKQVASLIEETRKKVASTINEEMVVLYWNIGKIIKEAILRNDRAEYGKQIVQSLTAQLVVHYGRGFSKRNLWYMVQLYENYPMLKSLIEEFKNLSWTHVIVLLPLKDRLERRFYSTLCQKELWSTRTLKDRINSMLYERTALSKLPGKTIENQLLELKEKDKLTPELVLRDPYVLDFLELHDSYNERDLEQAILNALEKFILEFGKDFCFVQRQKRILIDNEDFYIDLVFYHRRLKCLVVIDLKLGKFKAEYKGQMELYLRYLERNDMSEGENSPIGIILCSEKGKEKIELLFSPDDKINVSEYLTSLPSKELLAERLNRAVKSVQLKLPGEDE
jgi:predicted nuclease of restriction endonuclease-like (RecB) superfamily